MARSWMTPKLDKLKRDVRKSSHHYAAPLALPPTKAELQAQAAAAVAAYTGTVTKAQPAVARGAYRSPRGGYAAGQEIMSYGRALPAPGQRACVVAAQTYEYRLIRRA